MSMIKKSSISALVALFALMFVFTAPAKAETNPFASQDLMTIVGDSDAKKGKCGEGKCGEGKAKKGKCGEGKCGEGKAKKGKCGEGKAKKGKKCGE